jgi:hypothetical protein
MGSFGCPDFFLLLRSTAIKVEFRQSVIDFCQNFASLKPDFRIPP